MKLVKGETIVVALGRRSSNEESWFYWDSYICEMVVLLRVAKLRVRSCVLMLMCACYRCENRKLTRIYLRKQTPSQKCAY